MAKKPKDNRTPDPRLEMSDLSRAYRTGAGEQPPQRLDDAILAEAHRAVSGRRSSHGPFGSSWTVPLSAAAVVVLSVGVVLFLARETPLRQQALPETASSDVHADRHAESLARQKSAARPELPAAPAPSSPPPQAETATPSRSLAKRAEKAELHADTTTAPAGAPSKHSARSAEESGVAAEAADNREKRRSSTASDVARVVELQVGNRTIRAELATTGAELERGLMHRDRLAPDAGMLFIFKPQRSVCMWMKNTRIPLSAAFLDRNGTVQKIADMQPMNETAHCADGAVRYVLELNQGVFAAAGVTPGMRIGGLPSSPD